MPLQIALEHYFMPKKLRSGDRVEFGFLLSTAFVMQAKHIQDKTQSVRNG